ncbi:ACP S-malonyltransferase [Pseudoalteromonas sp. McH1-42]|uniref:ACP S-malonyltransferase n=1 Tax=Pseudoalteromonas sp. McH1-42 TaxID=2917752 RepID=UPI001EF6920E|nr:ACP S-malonyltransferase [Pseudoalteromonas sp. McH1-42]MCG7563259.1 ACP S-malonyltransferase [Pseudoalteromonas sp. McH1-42]
MKSYLFPGQGAQYVGMGKAWFELFPEQTHTASEILGYCIKTLCLDDPHNQLNQTEFTQPALYVVSALAFLAHQQRDPIPADFMAGHSLGEYTALFAAGAVSFEDGLRLVQQRGALMSQVDGGAMAAVLALDEATIRTCLTVHQLETLDIANLNSPKQSVLSGLNDDISRAQQVIEQAGGRFIRLNTSGAFHSRYMAGVQADFARCVAEVEFKAPSVPVIANVSARPYQDHTIQSQLIAQLTSSVRWTDSIAYLLAQGDMTFVELGPKKILTKLVAEIKQQATSLPASNAAKTTILKDPTAQQIERWNQSHGVGTQIRVAHLGEPLRTRTPAMLLFGHRPAVYVEGVQGYIALDEATPL